jgi:aspartyl-tRNA(Asn)/glutamyl-tRNA(Gln) amidotransferase subunit A
VAIGTDTGGSIRIPSSLQGIFGLKTSFGFIPNRGLVFLSRFRDVIGPMSKNLDDLEIMLKVISDTKNIPKFEQSLVAGKTFYVPREFFDHCDEHIRNLFSNVVRGLEAKGASVDFIKIWPSVKKFERMGKLSIAIEWQRILDDVLTKAKVGKPVAKLPFDPAVKYLYEKSSELKEYYSLEKFSQEFANFQKAFLRKYKDVDYFIMPTLPYFPPKISQLETPMQRRKILIDYTNQNRIASLIGLPALNIPMGRGPHDIPAGFQIVGKYGKDFELIQLAKEMGYRAIDL